jgi:hypothetical protein
VTAAANLFSGSDSPEVACAAGGAVFHEVRAATIEQLQALLHRIITRIVKLLSIAWRFEREGQ